MTYEQALQIAIEELYDAVEYLKAMNKGFPRVEAQCNELMEAHDLLRKALEDAETDRLRAKKKQIYEDLKSEQTHNTKSELKYDPETGEPLIDGYPLYSGLPKREWVDLTEEEIEAIADRIKVDELSVKKSTWHIRFAQAVQRNLKEKNARSA